MDRSGGTDLANSPLLEVRRLSVSYDHSPDRIRALRDVSLEIERGETLALVGETGSGKSTLAHSVMGLLNRRSRVDSGEILFEGHDLQTLKPHERKDVRSRKIGIVFQDTRSSLNPVLTIGSHLTETLRAHEKISGKDARTRALALLQEVGIPGGHRRLYPFELSGGECQRVGIALAICHRPRLLIADEPTSAVDSTLQAQILDLLQAMKERYGLALLLISHDLPLISQVSDRMAVMYHGRIVESGLVQEILTAPAHPYSRALLQCQPDLRHHHETHPLAAIPGSAPNPGEDTPGCAFAPRCEDREPRCKHSVPAVRGISRTHRVACIRSSKDERDT
jgi:oligopeptide/dipeptide ABC transporter ATP-binding protein